MKQHNPELVSALVDGELRGLRRWLFQRHLRACVICQAEFRHVQHVRRMLAAHPPKALMDDAPECFWSKVKREIEARGPAAVAAPEPPPTLSDWLRGHLPAVATTAIVVLVLIAGLAIYRGRLHSTTVIATGPASPVVMRADTKIPDTAATTIAGQDRDVTVIWVSGLPWTPDMTEMQTLFAQLDT